MKTNRFVIISLLFIFSLKISAIGLGDTGRNINLSERNVEGLLENEVLAAQFSTSVSINENQSAGYFYEMNSPTSNDVLNPIVAEMPESFFQKYFGYIILGSMLFFVILIRIFFLK